MNVELVRGSLIEDLIAEVRVARFRDLGRNRKTVLEDLEVKAAVIRHLCGLIPYPYEVSVAGGVGIPSVAVGLQNNGGRLHQGFLGIIGCLFAPGLDLTRGLGSVDSEVSCLEKSRVNNGGGNVEMRGVTVNVGLDGCFGMCSSRVRIKLEVCGKIYEFADLVRARGSTRVLTLTSVAGCKRACEKKESEKET